ncbi:hypothetical protein AMATHDRAFT_61327 [Amanita thiersii Skay4041]|uniref:Uncharacterized protein n=1 Tax=Amanita thiersii Skay4041 TaxID=703135 RepID=A0A2A9NPU9_9AGAR|nr:hypothetical protein AMATHDRAFT_61327 [Amanita thiersii Skay4041]
MYFLSPLFSKDVGEIDELMPGSSAQLQAEIEPHSHTLSIDEEEELLDVPEWRPHMLIQFLELLQSIIALLRPSKSPNPFVERFKYDIISSSLLSSTLQTNSHHRPLKSPSIPGKLFHSRTPSMETNIIVPPPPPVPVSPPEANYTTFSLAAAAIAVFYISGFTFLAFLSLTAFLALLHSIFLINESSKLDMTPCLTSLNELITASDAWESIIQEAISSIEIEEQSILYGSITSSSSPSSSIRVALHSSLLTTQTQCDNVRQLFSALTSPVELQQLSEMYAPQSPTKSMFSQPDNTTRPLSLPISRSRPLSTVQINSRRDKRLTWNGSYTSLADSVSPLPNLLRRREKRRSNLASVLNTPTKKSSSAPATPFGVSPSHSLSGVCEDVIAEEESIPTFQNPGFDSFGAAALELQRSLKVEGAEAFRSCSSPRGRVWTTISPCSSLSSLQNSRHPLSLPSLQDAIHSAASSKRYACSYLLALRFSEDDDEAYWEDVRSVMGLLTTTLSDASSRLQQALEDHEKAKMKESRPLTPLFETDDLLQRSTNDDVLPPPRGIKRKCQDSISFAPIPGPFARFSAHVAAISSALEDAREHLDGCIAALKEDVNQTNSPSSRRKPVGLSQVEGSTVSDEHPGLMAYERLRRELGSALRECERGRERLLEIVKPRQEPDGNDSDFEGLPGLGHDTSDCSDKPGPNSLSDSEDNEILGRGSLVAFLNSKIPEDAGALDGERNDDDDATRHLLLSASAQHLPPALGVEQVFEAETGTTPGFTRERSKMTREERIKLMKARREAAAAGRKRDSGFASWGDSEKGSVGDEGVVREKWGPGGEVVQELRDVIWKVSERRRKFADGVAGARRESVDAEVVDVGVVDVAVTVADASMEEELGKVQLYQSSDDTVDEFGWRGEC